MDKIRPKRKVFVSNESGKLPPQEIDLEEAVLGALMIENTHTEEVLGILKRECFYKNEHNIIYGTIQDMYNQKQVIDILTITAELKKIGKLEEVGGAYYITQLTNRVSGTAHTIHHAIYIAQAYLKREVIRLTSEFSYRAFDDMEDVDELINELYKEIDTIKNFGTEGNDTPFSKHVDDRVTEKERQVKEGIKITGITTGNAKLDSIIGGFVKSNLIIVAARPAMGKSVKALNYAKICAEVVKKPAAVFSLEMSSQELVDRLIVEECKVPLHHYRSNEITHYQLDMIKNGGKRLRQLPIIIDDTPAINCAYIRRKVKRILKKYGELGLIVVDYLQLMNGDGKIREQEISSISRGLKGIAKEFDVPVIALAQVGRGAEQNKDKRPELKDLRESGAIENDADVVMFIYRPSYYFDYGQHPDDMYSQDNILESDYNDTAEIIIAKNRNGIPQTKFKERFFGAFSCFSQYDKSVDETPFLDEEPENSDIIPF